MPLPGVVPLSPVKRDAIISARIAGEPCAQIAKRLECHITTISRVWKRFKEAGGKVLDAEPSITQRKVALITPAFSAIARGLADESQHSRYSAGLAVNVLKGIGVFAPDQQTTLNLLATSVPADWQPSLPAVSLPAITEK